MLTESDREALAELVPVLRRGVDLDPGVLARIRLGGVTARVFVRLPFGVLVARTVESAHSERADGTRADGERSVDVAVRAVEVLRWLDGDTDDPPPSRDHDWRTGLPPTSGWQRLDTVPDDVIRPLVRQGALALKDAATREGVPGAQPRAEVADALLDSVVLTVTGRDGEAAVTLRALSALTRMGFLARGGDAHVDLSGRWVRVAATYGTVYLERPGATLTLS